jgi:His-Xaa-Ser system radical SAM maturase HxsC
MAIQLRAKGMAEGGPGRIMGRVTRAPVDAGARNEFIRVIAVGNEDCESLDGYAAVLFEGKPTLRIDAPVLYNYGTLEFLRDDYVVVVDSRNGFTHVLYRPDSRHNAIFSTSRCNSHCIMCSQPPREVDDSGVVQEHLRLIDLFPNQPEHLAITGGEPTLLKDDLIEIVSKLKIRLPETAVTMLSNGRMYSCDEYVKKLAGVGHPNFLTSIPIYASNATDHDYVVQAMGAFDQTIEGLYNAAKYGLSVELRVVLHKQTIPGLLDLAEFIYRNLPFVQQIALMGLENMGYVKKNWDIVWIDPVDYARELEVAVRYLHYRRCNVSIYNLPLCLLPRGLWAFARRSISDFKNIYLDECEACDVKEHCCGLFQSSEVRHSRGIAAVRDPRVGGQ